MTVHVFQIGCKDIGRLGFERFLEFEEYFPVDVVFEGIHCKDFEAEKRAESFADSFEKDIRFFNDIDALYSAATDVNANILIYDAGPPQLHSRNIAKSLTHDFNHLTEKPPSVTRKEHINERKLAANTKVNYKIDFIERENPVVQKIGSLIEDENEEENIENVTVFRESSFGIQKVLQPAKFAHVKGGAVLDKMSNEIYVVDMLDGSLEFETASIDYFMPKDLGGEKVLKTDGSASRKIDEKTAIGKCKGIFSSGNVSIKLKASWLGLSDRSRVWNQKIEEMFGKSLTNSQHVEINDKGFQEEECRFLVIDGNKKLLGDLMNQKLYNLKEEKVIEVKKKPRDQLYRVLERAVLDAAGIKEYQINEDEVEEFMDGLFDVQESCEGNVFDAIDAASKRIRSLMSSDKKISEQPDAEGVAR
ncbi:MAG: hypothetical protein V5A72_03085 [Candidatus Nanohaloarchaea archaeon]